MVRCGAHGCGRFPPTPKPPGELPGSAPPSRKRWGIDVSVTKIFLVALVLLFAWFFYSIWTQTVNIPLGTMTLQWQMGWILMTAISFGFALGKIPFRLRM